MKNVAQYILDYLQNSNRAIVPYFGVFHLENSGAQLNNQNKSILPPSRMICFTPDFFETDQSIVEFISKEKNNSVENVIHELQTQTDFWKKKIAAGEEFSIGELGRFIFEDDQLVFKGSKLPSAAPDFFGLEEIVFSEIKNKDQIPSAVSNAAGENYKFNRSVLWLFLLIIPLLALAYFGYTNKEFIFGKKSFEDVSIKNATHRIEDQKPAKIQDKTVDPTKIDSLKPPLQNINNQ